MARREIVTLACDICEKGASDGATVVTRRVGLNGTEYEFDACERCYGSGILAAFAAITSFARKVTTKPKAAARVPKGGGEAVPFPGTNWIFTFHALLRMGERKLDPLVVCHAADKPDSTRPGERDTNAVVHTRGRIKVLLDPATRTIITAARTDSEDDPD